VLQIALPLPLGLLVIAAAWRAWFLLHGLIAVDKDEAVLGLMGLRILLGDRPVFFYGQHYMGSAEAYLHALVFHLLDVTPVTLRLVPLGVSLLAVYLIYRLGATLYGRGVGLASGLFLALSPVFFTMWSLRARPSYCWLLVLGTALLLVALRWRRGQAPHWHPLLFGLLAGLGLWINQLLVLYAPPLLILLWGRPTRRGLAQAAVTLLGLVVGGLPLWLANLREPVTVQAIERQGVSQVSGQAGLPGYAAMLAGHLHTGLPVLLGYLQPHDPPVSWELLVPYPMADRWVPITVAATLVLGALGLGVGAIVRLLRAEDPGPLRYLHGDVALSVHFLVVPLLVYVSPPSAYQAANPRYLIILYCCVPLFIAAAARALQWGYGRATRARLGRALPRGALDLRVWGGLALLPLLWVNVHGHQDMHRGWTTWVEDDAQVRTLAEHLQSHEVRTVYAEDWIAFPLSFLTRYEIVATEPGCFRRIPADAAHVAAAPTGAWILNGSWLGLNGMTEAAVHAQLQQAGSHYIREVATGFVIMRDIIPPSVLPVCREAAGARYY